MHDEIIDVENIAGDDNKNEGGIKVNIEAKVRLITFYLDNEIYGIEVCNVREILLVNQNFPVPGAPHFVLGITNIRGNVVTIIDARKRFNLPDANFTATDPESSVRMIVMESGDNIAAVLVDSVSDVIDVEKRAIDLNPKIKVNSDSMYISGVVTHSDKLVIILNVDGFLAEEGLDMASGF